MESIYEGLTNHVMPGEGDEDRKHSWLPVHNQLGIDAHLSNKDIMQLCKDIILQILFVNLFSTFNVEYQLHGYQ